MRKLGLHICKTNIGTQKIDGSRLKTFRIIITFFWIDNKDKNSRYFEKT